MTNEHEALVAETQIAIHDALVAAGVTNRTALTVSEMNTAARAALRVAGEKVEQDIEALSEDCMERSRNSQTEDAKDIWIERSIILDSTKGRLQTLFQGEQNEDG